MKPYRSMLFVPAHKPTWADKAVATGTDALILDLEDSVPPADKADGRKAARGTIERLRTAAVRPAVWVRPNSADSGQMGADLEDVVVPGLRGLFLPKVVTAREIVGIDAVLTHLEQREGLTPGSVELIVTFETAVAMAHCEEIAAASPRIASLLGGTGPNADVSRELGFQFSVEGLETLYLRSRIVLACRSNGLHHPLAGVWQDIADLEGFRRFAEDNRRLGYRGIVLIHPSHVQLANEVFTPSADTVAFYRRMITAYREAESHGSSAVDFEGQMIDLAHARTAEGVIALAEAVSAS
jgi:citrate lyase subunit beta/citryl-CoA lyase